MRNGDRCRHCGRRLQAGRALAHTRQDCTKPWYIAQRQKRTRPPGRPPVKDYTPEQIERIMNRRAIEQRAERAREQA